jgi:hypothetical protein
MCLSLKILWNLCSIALWTTLISSWGALLPDLSLPHPSGLCLHVTPVGSSHWMLPIQNSTRYHWALRLCFLLLHSQCFEDAQWIFVQRKTQIFSKCICIYMCTETDTGTDTWTQIHKHFHTHKCVYTDIHTSADTGTHGHTCTRSDMNRHMHRAIQIRHTLHICILTRTDRAHTGTQRNTLYVILWDWGLNSVRALSLQNRHSITWATPPVHFALVILEARSCKLLAWAGFELRSSCF